METNNIADYNEVGFITYSNVKLESLSEPKIETKKLTWNEIVSLEPRIGDLYEFVKDMRRKTRKYFYQDIDYEFCLNEIYYKLVKPRITRFVGWKSLHEDPRMRTHETYDTVFRKIYWTIPSCWGCGCCSPSLERHNRDVMREEMHGISMTAECYYDFSRTPKQKRAQFNIWKQTEDFRNFVIGLLEWQDFSCCYCGKSIPHDDDPNKYSPYLPQGFVFDHVVPLSRGGANTDFNIVVSCDLCNLKKGTKIYKEDLVIERDYIFD